MSNSALKYKKMVVPSVYPVTLEAAKLHLKMDDINTDDTLITALIAAATTKAELYCNRCFINTTIHQFYDNFDCLKLAVTPFFSIESVNYTDVNGDLLELDLTKIQTDSIIEPAQIYAKNGVVFPELAEGTINPVRVVYTAGFGTAAADVPPLITQAILLIIGDWYDNRNDAVRTLTQASQRILNMYRVTEF